MVGGGGDQVVVGRAGLWGDLESCKLSFLFIYLLVEVLGWVIAMPYYVFILVYTNTGGIRTVIFLSTPMLMELSILILMF